MKIYGHRGASHAAPENTIPALALAMESDIAGVEFDIRITRDGKFVLIHDPHTKRISDINLAVNKFDYRELQEINIAAHKKKWRKRERLALLEEALETVVRGEILIHIKDRGEEMIEALCGVLDRYPDAAGRARFLSFSQPDLQYLKKLRPDWFAINLFARKNNTKALASVLVAGVDGIGLQRLRAQENYVRMIQESGLLTYVWTINKDKHMRRMIEIGIDAVATDKPEKFAKLNSAAT